MSLSDLLEFSHERQCFIMKDTRPPANAFEWQRYVVEEDIRRGGAANIAKASGTAQKRSVAASKTVERTRTANPAYGTLSISAKTAKMIALKPKDFIIYSKVRKGEGK